jgi:glycerate kinase
VISRTVLIALEPFGEGLDAQRAAAAIGRGICAQDPTLAIDLCCAPPPAGGDLDALRRDLEAVDFDTRMRAARAIVVGAERLDESTLLGSATFEIATRARQAGVPAYAVAGENVLSPFDARILDLQVILRARDTRALRRAGQRLAQLV